MSVSEEVSVGVHFGVRVPGVVSVATANRFPRRSRQSTPPQSQTNWNSFNGSTREVGEGYIFLLLLSRVKCMDNLL